MILKQNLLRLQQRAVLQLMVASCDTSKQPLQPTASMKTFGHVAVAKDLGTRHAAYTRNQSGRKIWCRRA